MKVTTPLSASPRFRLTLLGRIGLTGVAGAPGPAGLRRRPLALLALLAASGERGLSRDRLLLYLWPESDMRHGRNTLSQTLHTLRRDLRADDVVTGAATLALNPNVIGCDLWDFERSVAAGMDEEAVAIYSGPFLDDFSLAGLPEFDAWIEGERRRLERRHREALERMARSAESAGFHARALGWWRRLAEAEPLSARSAAGVIRTLAASGDRSAALDHARAYASLVRAELDSDPDASVAKLVDQIRRTGLGAGPARGASPLEPPERAWPASSDEEGRTSLRLLGLHSADPARDEVVHRGNAPSGAIQEAQAPRVPHLGLRSVRVALVAGSSAALLIMTGAWEIGRRPAAREHLAAPRVAVLPFQVAAPDSHASLAASFVEILTGSLDGADVVLIDPSTVRGWLGRDARGARPASELGADAAEGLGATAYVTGNVAVIGDRMRVSARWHDLPPGRTWLRPPAATLVAHAAAEGAPHQLLTLSDRVAAQLLANRHLGAAARLTRAAAWGTDSLAAVKAYLSAERERRAGRYVRALDEYARAVAIDGGFALAQYRLSVTAEWLGRDSLARVAATQAFARVQSLPGRDRGLVTALAAHRRGDGAAAVAIYRELLDDYPNDVEASFQLGEMLFHGNPLIGRSATEARPAFEHVTELEPDNREALVHLARIAAIEGRRAGLDSLRARLLATTTADALLELHAFRSLVLDEPARVGRASGARRRSPASVDPAAALGTGVYRGDLTGVRALAGALAAPGGSPDVRALGYRLLARTEAARGRWTAASAFLDSAGMGDSDAALALRALLASSPSLRVPRAAQAAALAQASAAPGTLLLLHRRGLLFAALGEPERARWLADSIARLPLPEGAARAPSGALARSVRASAAHRDGRYAEVLRILDEPAGQEVDAGEQAEAHDRFLRAEALRELGRADEAAGWYASMAERSASELPYLAPSEQRLGAIFDARGDIAAARRHYERFVALWADADPPLQAAVATVRRRLAELAQVATRPRASADRRPP